MMTFHTSGATCVCDGTSALSSRPRTLVLLEGGHVPEGASAEGVGAMTLGRRDSILFMLAGFAVIGVLCLASLFSDSMISERRADALSALPMQIVTVRSGDSLWKIAEQHGHEGYATADLVALIEDMNDLSLASVVPGQQLVVPMAS